MCVPLAHDSNCDESFRKRISPFGFATLILGHATDSFHETYIKIEERKITSSKQLADR